MEQTIKYRKSAAWGLSALVFGAVLATVPGCGGSGTTAVDQDELNQFLEDNPELKNVDPELPNTAPLDDPDATNARPAPV